MVYRAPDFKTVAIFGGTGFIGRYIVRDLAKRSWRVNVATRDADRARHLQPLGTVGQICPVFANVRDEASTAAAVRGADYVINLVGILYESGAQKFESVHAAGAGRIAKAAAEAGAERMIHISAIGADPNSPSQYARTKAEGEKAVLDAFPDATILRPSIVFGPEDGFFNMFAGMARYLPVLPLIGGGHTRFQPVYVGDVADAVMACLDDRKTCGKVFELGGPRVYSFRRLLEMILEETRRKRLLMPLPWPIARAQAKVLGALPKPLLTPDQVTQLERDNVVADGAATLQDLGIEPTALEVILPTYMDRYRLGGRFAARQKLNP